MNKKSGFSLFEVTVALFILSVSVIAVYQTISSSTLSVYSLENRTLAREIANNRIALLNTIEKPNIPDRQQWLNDLGYAHWSLNEIRNGEYWTRVKDQILKEHNG